MVRHVIIACSAQKKKSEGARHVWSNQLTESQWIQIISKEKKTYTPESLYTGQHFIGQKKLIHEQGDRLWIASAGLGLLNGDVESPDLVPSYDAAFTKKYGSNTESWSSLPFGGLNRLLESDGDIVIAVPIQYQKAIIADINFKHISERVIALGPGPLREQSNVTPTPYHPRMSEKKVLGGQKLALFTKLLEAFYEDATHFSVLFEAVAKAESLPPPVLRKKIPSQIELDEIVENLPTHITSGGAAVRYIRDVLRRSASQERILMSWREARKPK